jgi:nitroimidazol reductase NimA-like FMN-containing flavoprotein (pyridoxamine 5'-phosphate oxidase superfamily)
MMAWSKTKKLKFLNQQPVIRVATVGRSGRPQVTPVCHVVSDGRIYWASYLDAAKLANISHHRTVALVADVYQDNWKNLCGVMAQGKARIFKNGSVFRRVRGLLYSKFPLYKSNHSFDEGGAVIIEVTPTKLISWSFKY